MALRRTALARNTPLTSRPKATTYERPAPPPMNLAHAAAAMQNQAASAAAPRREHTPIPDPTPATPRPKDTGFPAIIRQTILDRDTPPGEDRPTCQRCGITIYAGSVLGYSLQHRDNRAMGGTRDPRVNWPSNGIVLCGSATTGCHAWAEANRSGEASRLGFVVESWADPETVPVKTHRLGWVTLSRSGSMWLTAEPPNADARIVARRKAAL